MNWVSEGVPALRCKHCCVPFYPVITASSKGQLPCVLYPHTRSAVVGIMICRWFCHCNWELVGVNGVQDTASTVGRVLLQLLVGHYICTPGHPLVSAHLHVPCACTVVSRQYTLPTYLWYSLNTVIQSKAPYKITKRAKTEHRYHNSTSVTPLLKCLYTLHCTHILCLNPHEQSMKGTSGIYYTGHVMG